MTIRRSFSAVAVGLICATALTGCLTPRAKPAPSAAILEARARMTAKPSACPTEGLDAISPVSVGFAFDDPAITTAGQVRLTAAARWLACNPTIEAVVQPDADHHGPPAHLDELAQQRGQAVQSQLRALGANANVVRLLARGGADPVKGPHMLIVAEGRGW